MNIERTTEIIDEEIEQDQIDPKEEARDAIFDELKNALIEQKRLIGRFYEFSSEHGDFEYDELGDNMEEGDEILRRANKIRDKFLDIIETELLYIFENRVTNTHANIIAFDLDAKDYQFRVVIEVYENSFDLEVI